MRVLISTDSSCLINYTYLDKYNISLLPLNVIIDGEEYLDGITINQETLGLAMNENKVIKTSTPPLGVVIEYFESIFNKGYDKIIHFTISSKLSSMNSFFNTVSKEYFNNNVIVIDSYSLSSLMLSHVIYAYEEVNKGTDIEIIVEEIEKRKKNSSILFIPENLKALKNGGRISPAVAAIGNTLGLKPVISLTDGELRKESMTRSVKKTFSDYIKDCVNTYSIQDYDYNLISFEANEKTIEYLHTVLDEVIGYENYIKGIIPINVCAHCGPGTIGLVISPKVNGKSIKDFN